jgi:hypothetical protein
MSGTGVQKNEKLKKFKEDNIQVILLSLEKSASGLNLIDPPPNAHGGQDESEEDGEENEFSDD